MASLSNTSRAPSLTRHRSVTIAATAASGDPCGAAGRDRVNNVAYAVPPQVQPTDDIATLFYTGGTSAGCGADPTAQAGRPGRVGVAVEAADRDVAGSRVRATGAAGAPLSRASRSRAAVAAAERAAPSRSGHLSPGPTRCWRAVLLDLIGGICTIQRAKL
jgi:hypothetical protein